MYHEKHCTNLWSVYYSGTSDLKHNHMYYGLWLIYGSRVRCWKTAALSSVWTRPAGSCSATGEKLVMRCTAWWGGFIGRPGFIITIITSQPSLLKTHMYALFHPLTLSSPARLQCSRPLTPALQWNYFWTELHNGLEVRSHNSNTGIIFSRPPI